MQDKVIKRLNDLNRSFYEHFASSFAGSRGASEPGLARVLAAIAPGSWVLDLGCAQGRFAQLLPSTCRYTGVDFSPALAALAETQTFPVSAHFVVADLLQADWPAQLAAVPAAPVAYDVILARAVLHHIPAYAQRLRVLRQAAALLAHDGRLILANWQFLDAARFRKRLQPWSSIGLEETDVEAGDCLLDWRREGLGLRYVHHIDLAETQQLAADAGLTILETYYADGREGNLTLYTILASEQR